jgi:hypothetical protein
MAALQSEPKQVAEISMVWASGALLGQTLIQFQPHDRWSVLTILDAAAAMFPARDVA